MTDVEPRLLARAASQLAALTQPDVAAVLGALPRRPGSTASLADLVGATGLDLRVLGKAVARGRDAGVLRVDGDRVGLGSEGARRTVEELVARTPLGAALADHGALAQLAPFGVIESVPTGDDAPELLALVVALLPTAPISEAEITARLAALAADAVGLRRALVDAGLVWRTSDGATYQREDAR